MTKTDFLHEMKAIATIQKVLKELDRREGRLENRLFVRVNKLLDIAVKYLPEDTELERS